MSVVDYVMFAWIGIGVVVAIVWAATSEPHDLRFEESKGWDMLLITGIWPFVLSVVLILLVCSMPSRPKP